MSRPASLRDLARAVGRAVVDDDDLRLERSASTCSSTPRIVAFSLYAGIRKETLGTRGVYGPARFALDAITILVAVAVVAGLVLRVWILATPLGALDSDEAISGLIATAHARR